MAKRKITVTPEEVAAFTAKYLVWNVSYERHIQAERGKPASVVKVTGKTAFGFNEEEAIENFNRMHKSESIRKIFNVQATRRCTMAEFNKTVYGDE